MKTIADFLTHYRRQRRWTRKLVAAIPEQHFDWAPAQSAFRCSDLVRHMMQAEIFWRRLFTAATSGEQYDPFQFTGTASERYTVFRGRNLQISQSEKLGRSPAALLEQWERIQADTERELGAITPEQLAAVEVEHPMACLRLPLWEMLLAMVEHEVHHRGQLSA
ncbi:MAG TPA: DinB family protein, partial [Acidobacteriota bacterium]